MRDVGIPTSKPKHWYTDDAREPEPPKATTFNYPQPKPKTSPVGTSKKDTTRRASSPPNPGQIQTFARGMERRWVEGTTVVPPWRKNGVRGHRRRLPKTADLGFSRSIATPQVTHQVQILQHSAAVSQIRWGKGSRRGRPNLIFDGKEELNVPVFVSTPEWSRTPTIEASKQCRKDAIASPVWVAAQIP